MPRRLTVRRAASHGDGWARIWRCWANVQVSGDNRHHLIGTHEVTNGGTDRSQLAGMAKKAKEVLGVEELEAVADRGYYHGEEIIACAKDGITVTLPKPMTSGEKADGRFGKQDFAYLRDE